MREQFFTFFSEADWLANEMLVSEVGKIRDDLAPSWLEAPLSLEDTADRYIRKELRQTFINLVIHGLYSCSAGCHPAGSVIGAAGYNSAQCIIKDL